MLKTLHGIKTLFVARNSIARKAGLKKGDFILSVNGETIGDDLDFRFYSAQPELTACVLRANKKLFIRMDRPNGEDLGARFKERPIRRCCNNCIFCFIDQMPSGLRKSLYIKDEDYRYSFTNGNYLTLSSATPYQLGHIVELGLSPLFISVHATDVSVRGRMLGNSRAFDIMEQLRFLENNDVCFHTQIVVCPGINDGHVLSRTLRDLLTLKMGLLSIAVVPVGITRHRKVSLRPVAKADAMAICKNVGNLSDNDFRLTGTRKIFLADEFFIKAGAPVPENGYYEDYPQIENGVGLIRRLVIDWKSLKKKIIAKSVQTKNAKKRFAHKKYLVLTSVSALTFVKTIMWEMERMFSGVGIDVMAVKNDFFGESVTVAGLLTAYDIIKSAKPIAQSYTAIFIPAVMFNTHGYTMDGYSKARIEKQVGARIEVAANMEEMMGKIEK